MCGDTYQESFSEIISESYEWVGHRPTLSAITVEGGNWLTNVLGIVRHVAVVTSRFDEINLETINSPGDTGRRVDFI